MNLICSKKNLQKACLLSEKICCNNPNLPILNSVLISTDDSTAKFLSTNLEISLEIKISCSIKKPGKIALPAKLFSGLISSFKEEDDIKIESLNNGAVITTDKSSTTIKGYPAEDFPVLPKINTRKKFIVSVQDFLLGLKCVNYSTSLSEMRPELNSIFIYSSKDSSLSFTATDTFRLAEKTIPYNFADFDGFLLPHRSALEILKIFENNEEDLSIFIDDNNIVLESDKIRFISRLVDGVFPQYKQIIPKSFVSTAIVEKKEFLDALKSSSMFCGKLNEIKIRIYRNEDFIELQTSNSDIGEHTVSISAKTEGDEDIISLFNHRYLIDFLPSINSDKILLRFSGEGKPLLASPYGDASFSYLVMPMKDV